MFIYPNGNNNSNAPGDWVEAEEFDDDDDDDEANYDPNKPIMHLRRVEGFELIWRRFRERFFPETEGESDD